MTLLTSLPAAGGEADAPTFFVFSSSVYYPRPFVNHFFRKSSAYFYSPRKNYLRTWGTGKKEVYLMDNTKNTKTTNTETTENTNTKNTKNAKNTKNCK